jgi:hypothetical protein
MSDVRKTVCDGCGEQTSDKVPYFINGGRPTWARIKIERIERHGVTSIDITADACSDVCMVKVLRKIVDDQEKASQ